jgi:hypothetical protein
MTQISALITRAFRQENITAVGTSPTSAEQAEALEIINDLVRQLYGFELGELVYDWQVPPTKTAPHAVENPDDPYDTRENATIYRQPPSNVRLVTKLSAATTVYLPQFPNDGARIALTDAGSANNNLTLNANGRTIEGSAALALDLSAVTEREWFYRADLSDWTRVAELAADDESPFPQKYDMLLVTGVAIWLSPRFGKEPKNVTTNLFASLKSKFEAQYRQEIPTPATYDIADVQSLHFPGHSDPGGFASG